MKAHAKINPYLKVLAREVSGYHQIETLFLALELADDVDVEAGGSGIQLIVEGADLGSPSDNLAYRAAEAFFDQTRLPPSARIRIVKRIPVGGGLGGGSSDAAATLAALDAAHGHPLGAARLRELGSALGSDVPFFLSGHALALAWSRGERLLALPPLPPTPVLLVVPPQPSATAEIYAELSRRRPRHERAMARLFTLDDFASIDVLARGAHNDFEPIVFERIPVLADAKRILSELDATIAMLTGTGSTLFALFRNAPAAEQAATALAETLPEVRTIVTRSVERL